ncbi:MAG: hypothetical protein RLZZ175_1652 [Bacteroidota bacterium]|jgi:protein SCO1/2
MSKYTKVGTLMILLIVPAFFYLFIKLFGDNHYGLPKLLPLSVNSGDTTYFRFSHTLSEVEAKPINIVAITLLKGSWTTELDLRLSSNFKDDSSYFSNNDVLLEPDFSHLKSIETKFQVFLDEIPHEFWSKYKLIQPHEVILLVDKSGYIRGVFDPLKDKEIDRLITELKVFEHEYNHRKSK